MKINYNMSAVITNNQLLRTEGKLSDAMEKLSSGLRINHAKDDAAGMAISNKMRLQIDGLSQASRNASDGSSVIRTADGALNEVTSLIQRMRELSVQAANDSNVASDKAAIQAEISSLKDEVNRVCKDTEFNTKSLLNGSLDQRVYAENVSRLSTSIYVDAGLYQVTVNPAAEKAELSSDVATFGALSSQIGAAGTVNINGSTVDISATDTYETAFQKLRDAAERGEAEASLDGGSLKFNSAFYGSKAELKITFSNQTLANALGFNNMKPDTSAGTDAGITLTNGFSGSATTNVDGNRVIITDKNGFEMSFLVDEGFSSTNAVDIEVADIGAMTLQIGANQHQTMDVRIPRMSCESLYIDDVDVTTVNGAGKALDRLDQALGKVLAVRSSLGAYENRLDYAVASLDETGENMTQALSRIEDVDMAEEMSNYTQQNVLEQAAISVLTQANDLPQQTLQLLQ